MHKAISIEPTLMSYFHNSPHPPVFETSPSSRETLSCLGNQTLLRTSKARLYYGRMSPPKSLTQNFGELPTLLYCVSVPKNTQLQILVVVCLLDGKGRGQKSFSCLTAGLVVKLALK